MSSCCLQAVNSMYYGPKCLLSFCCHSTFILLLFCNYFIICWIFFCGSRAKERLYKKRQSSQFVYQKRSQKKIIRDDRFWSSVTPPIPKTINRFRSFLVVYGLSFLTADYIDCLFWFFLIGFGFLFDGMLIAVICGRFWSDLIILQWNIYQLITRIVFSFFLVVFGFSFTGKLLGVIFGIFWSVLVFLSFECYWGLFSVFFGRIWSFYKEAYTR